MEDKLPIIKRDCIKRRIKRDLEDLVNEKICVQEEISIIQSSEKEINIGFKNIKDNRYYDFIISEHYPFIPPKLKINNKSIKCDEFVIYLKNYTNIDDFYSESILSTNNWSPVLTFKDIIYDIHRFTIYYLL